MIGLALQALLAATPVPLPPECELPDERNALVLRDFAQKSGALSVGLDSVATWCFESSGRYSAGSKAKVAPEKPEAECAKALAACETAKASITDDARNTLVDVLQDLKRPYRGLTYKPRRSGLSDRPTEAANCTSQVRSELYTQAAARMDLARLASQAQNEYANYRTWLYAESLKCARAVRLGQPDARRGISIDAVTGQGGADAGTGATAAVTGGPGATSTTLTTQPTAGSAESSQASRPASKSAAGDAGLRDAGSALSNSPVNTATSTKAPGSDSGTPRAGTQLTLAPWHPDASVALDAGPSTAAGVAAAVPTSTGSTTSTVTTTPTATTTTTTETGAQETALLERWRYFAGERAKLERDGDYVSGFLNSKELRDCKCQRVTPSALVARIEAHDGVPQLLSDDAKNNACELCLLDAYVGWKVRAQKWCKQMGSLSDYEVGVLERSDEGSGIPARCFEETRAKRTNAPAAAVTGKTAGVTAAPAGTPGSNTPGVSAAGTPGSATTQTRSTATSGSTATTSNGSGFVITKVEGGSPSANTIARANVDTFTGPESYAQIPTREDGRLYVRLFMSSSCSADIWPGPMKARTGDLMPIALNSRSLTVKSPCGGLAEVYWGREEKPRVSEVFGRNQPLSLQFQPQ